MCDGNMFETQIETVFQAVFPIKNLKGFYLVNNEYIRELTRPLFNDVTFDEIYIQKNDLVHINESFFHDQENSLTELISWEITVTHTKCLLIFLTYTLWIYHRIA